MTPELSQAYAAAELATEKVARLTERVRELEEALKPPARFDGRSIRLCRMEAEFLVDACEKDRIPQWMDLAAEIREAFGMAPFPAGDALAKREG